MVDLPTPPLPEATAITCLTPASALVRADFRLGGVRGGGRGLRPRIGHRNDEGQEVSSPLAEIAQRGGQFLDQEPAEAALGQQQDRLGILGRRAGPGQVVHVEAGGGQRPAVIRHRAGDAADMARDAQVDQRRMRPAAQAQRLVSGAVFADVVQHLGQRQFQLGDDLVPGAAVEPFAQEQQRGAHRGGIGAEDAVEHRLAGWRGLAKPLSGRLGRNAHLSGPSGRAAGISADLRIVSTVSIRVRWNTRSTFGVSPVSVSFRPAGMAL